MRKAHKQKPQRLEKKLSPSDVWSLALGSIIGWGAFVMPGNLFLPAAGPMGTAIAMTIAAVAMILLAFNYAFMAKNYPVAGGGFIYTLRAFGEKQAYWCGWFLGLAYLTIIPLNATALSLIASNLLGDIFKFGFAYELAGYTVHFGEILLGIVALGLFAYFSVTGVKFTGSFQSILVFMLIGSIVIICSAALFSDSATLSNLTPAFSPNPNTSIFAGILVVISVAPWAFVGFNTVPQSVEEYNFSTKKVLFLMIFSIVFGALIYVLLNTITAAVLPEGFSSWEGYIAAADHAEGLQSLPTFYAAKILLGNAGLVLMGGAVLAGVLTGIIGFYMATSRLLYAISHADMLHSWFGVLHKKHNTPANAVIFCFVVSCIAPFLGRNALIWIVDMSSVGIVIGYGYTSAAALKLAKSQGNRAIMATGAFGVIISLIYGVILLMPISDAALKLPSYIALAIWVAIGVVMHRQQNKAVEQPTTQNAS